MEQITISIDELNAAVKAAVDTAMEAFRPKKEEILIPRGEAAKLLKKHPSTLWRWEREGYLVPAVRRGRTVLYNSRDLAQLGVVIE